MVLRRSRPFSRVIAPNIKVSGLVGIMLMEHQRVDPRTGARGRFRPPTYDLSRSEAVLSGPGKRSYSPRFVLIAMLQASGLGA